MLILLVVLLGGSASENTTYSLEPEITQTSTPVNTTKPTTNQIAELRSISSQPVKLTISLTMEVKMETVNLKCTSTGPPFLKGYWKVGHQKIYNNMHYNDLRDIRVTEQLSDTKGLQTLTLTLTLLPSQLQFKEYSCHVSSLETEIMETINVHGDWYNKYRTGGDECSKCEIVRYKNQPIDYNNYKVYDTPGKIFCNNCSMMIS